MSFWEPWQLNSFPNISELFLLFFLITNIRTRGYFFKKKYSTFEFKVWLLSLRKTSIVSYFLFFICSSTSSTFLSSILFILLMVLKVGIWKCVSSCLSLESLLDFAWPVLQQCLQVLAEGPCNRKCPGTVLSNSQMYWPSEAKTVALKINSQVHKDSCPWGHSLSK